MSNLFPISGHVVTALSDWLAIVPKVHDFGNDHGILDMST
jgi:hypothetical protein